MTDILIRGGEVHRRHGRASRYAPMSRSPADRIAAIGAAASRARRRARDRCRGPRGRAGLHRHQDPFRLHPAAQPAGREQDPPGRHHRGDRPLRLLGRAGAAGQGRRCCATISRRARPGSPSARRASRDYLDGFPATSTNVVPLVGHNTLRLMVMGMAPRAARRGRDRRRWRRCSRRRSTPARWGFRPGSSRRPAPSPRPTRSSRWRRC